MRQVRSIMGMPVQLEIVDIHATDAVYEEVFQYLRSIDEKFSTYKKGSEISLINTHNILKSEYSKEMIEVFALSADISQKTRGYFNINTPEGIVDPSGLVKGWAINNAAKLIQQRGFTNFYVEIAGDIQTGGLNSKGEPWSIGIRNPFVDGEVVKIVYPHGHGVATSGTYLRGSHLYNPHAPSDSEMDFVSLTVIGPTVYEADCFATAAFVMGRKGMLFLEELDGFEGYSIDKNGEALMTSNFENYTAP